MTFSRSLAHYLAERTGTRVRRCRVVVGRRLAPGEESSTGIYALLSRKKGTILRVSTIHGFAQELADFDSRVLHEAGVTPDAP